MTASPKEALTVNTLPRSVSADAALASSRSCAREPAVQQHAELVAAEAIGPPAGTDRRAQRGSDSSQQGIAGGVTEAVVVALEAVEIEEHQRGRAPAPSVLHGVLEVLHQPAPVPQPAQRVGDRLVSVAAQHPHVLQIGQRRAHRRQQQARPRRARPPAG